MGSSARRSRILCLSTTYSSVAKAYHTPKILDTIGRRAVAIAAPLPLSILAATPPNVVSTTTSTSRCISTPGPFHLAAVSTPLATCMVRTGLWTTSAEWRCPRPAGISSATAVMGVPNGTGEG